MENLRKKTGEEHAQVGRSVVFSQRDIRRNITNRFRKSKENVGNEMKVQIEKQMVVIRNQTSAARSEMLKGKWT